MPPRKSAAQEAPIVSITPAVDAGSRRLVFSEGTSHKFWEASCTGAEMTVTFGRIGTAGQKQVKSFADAAQAQVAMAKLVAEKTSKGYRDAGASPAVATATTATTAAKTSTADKTAKKQQATKPSKAAKNEQVSKAGKQATKPSTAKSVESTKADKTAKVIQPSSAKSGPEKSAKAAKEDKPQVTNDGWISGPDGYHLTVREGKTVCRNAKGKELATVPPKVADSPAGEQLDALVEWLEDHGRDCRAQVEGWMLRSLPVPTSLIAATWPDPAWRVAFENTVVCAADAVGRRNEAKLGFLRGADPARGIGLVTIDGETAWMKSVAVMILHPVLLPERSEFQALGVELALPQGIQQLLRETFVRTSESPTAESVMRFSGGEFEQLSHATGRCRQLGYAVSGGYAICEVIEGGVATTARFWIGSEDPESETTTGDLSWTGPDEAVLPLGKVPPVAFSEGMRMASAIFAKRKVADKKEA